MRYLNAADTRAALPMLDAIEAMEHAFSGESETPPRTLIGNSLVMPGRLDGMIAVKVVSVVPGNPAGLVAVFDAEGSPLGLVDGPTLTAIRTGAVCGLATRLLAPPEAKTLVMLGAGAMAFDQVEAVRAVRPIERILIWSRSGDRARALAGLVGGEPAAYADNAVAEADIISCATPATSPLWVVRTPWQCGNGWPSARETTTAEWRAGSRARTTSWRGGMWPLGDSHVTTVAAWGTRWPACGGPDVEKRRRV